METAYQLPMELRQLVADGHLSRIDDMEYSIDELGHRTLTGYGWQDIMYTLYIEPEEEEAFSIMEESRESGSDCVLATGDVEEVEWWIKERIMNAEL